MAMDTYRNFDRKVMMVASVEDFDFTDIPSLAPRKNDQDDVSQLIAVFLDFSMNVAPFSSSLQNISQSGRPPSIEWTTSVDVRMEMMEKGLLALLMLVLLRSWLGVAGNAEVSALAAFKAALNDPTSILQSWDTTLATPCTWFHVTCDPENRVTHIDLRNANLSGPLVPDLGQLPNLQYLELSNNSLSGRIPDELGNLVNLVTLVLYLNHLTGPIPNSLGNLKFLGNLQLNDNGLNGSIPMSLTKVTALQVLDLSNNNLEGIIPINGSFSKFTYLSFAGNTLFNAPTPPPPPPAPASSPPSAGRETGIIAGTVAAGAVLVFAALAYGFFLLGRRWRHTHFFDTLVASKSEEEPEVHFEQIKRFSLLELQVATDNFNPNNILGRGGFGKVYKGRLADGSFVAVKRLKEERSQGGELQFQSELKTISLATHQNLLKLHGFCMTPTERLLVYPYMANGSVASHLRAIEHRDSQPPLEWAIRKRVALGAARGLAYLHEQCNPKIIHCDMKAANVLLDEDFEVVVGDFGLARLMDCRETHVTTVIRGTIGHISPEYLSMGIVSDKNDVFGYGIMLLELITGKRAFDLTSLARNESVMLHDWVKELLRERRLAVLVDSDIQGNYIEEEVEQLIQIALLCTQVNAAERPRMSTVVGMLEGQGLAERWDQFRASNQPYQQNDFLSSDPGSTSRLLEDVLSGPR